MWNNTCGLPVGKQKEGAADGCSCTITRTSTPTEVQILLR